MRPCYNPTISRVTPPMKIAIIVASAAILIPMTSIAQSTPAKPEKKAVASSVKLTPEQVHRSALVIDTHEDTPQRFVDEHFDFADPTR